jgi:hypothetical protein
MITVALAKNQKMFLHNVLTNLYWFEILTPKFRERLRDVYEAGNYDDDDRETLIQFRSLYVATMVRAENPKGWVDVNVYKMWVDENSVDMYETRNW